MYFQTKIFDRTFFASSVAPPALNDLSPELQDLSISHILLAENHSFKKIIDKINSCEDSEIEKARLQFVHYFNELNSIYRKIGTYEYTSSKTPFQSAFTDVYNDVLDSAKETVNSCISAPTKISHIKKLNSCLDIIYQAKYINSVLKEQNQEIISTDQDKKLEEILAGYKQIEHISTVYPKLQAHIKNLEEIEKKSIEEIKKSSNKNFRLSFKEIEKAHMICGDKSVLWHMINSQNTKKPKSEFHYEPLSPKEVEQVRKTVSNTMSIHEGVVNPSFLSIMGYIGNCFEKLSLDLSKGSSKSVQSSLSEIMREEKKSLYGKKTLTKKEIEETTQRLEKNISATDLDSIIVQRTADDIFSHINLINKSFKNDENLDTEAKNTLTIKGVPGTMLIGSFSKNDKVFILFEDNEHKNISQNALWGAVIDKKDLKKIDQSKPINQETKDMIESNPNNKTSNFYSLSTMLSEISEPSIQQHFFGFEFDVKNEINIQKANKKSVKN